MGLNFEDLDLSHASEDVKKKNPDLFGRGGAAPVAPGPVAPSAPTGSARPRRGNPLLGTGSVRLPGGASPGSDPRFSATDVPFQPGGKQATPYTDVARQANEERRNHSFTQASQMRDQYRQQAAAAGRGGAGVMHPQQFGPFQRMRQGFQKVGSGLVQDRHHIAMIGADMDAMSRLHKGGHLGDLLEFSAGMHLEPIYRRMLREQEMGYFGSHGSPIPEDSPRVQKAARPAPLHFT